MTAPVARDKPARSQRPRPRRTRCASSGPISAPITGAVLGLVVIVIVLLLALFADFVAPHSPYLTNSQAFLKPPFWQSGGSLSLPARDGCHRARHPLAPHPWRALVAGDRHFVVAVSVAVGTVLGLVAGFMRGVVEILIMRAMDIVLTMPSLLLAIVIVAVLGPGLMNAMLAVAVVVLPHYVRVTRAAVLSELAKDYVTAAKVSNAGTLRLMFREVLPNCMAPLIVQASLGISTAILDAAALGFLGLGARPPEPEWGTMLSDAREFVLRAWWVVTFPGLDDPDHRAGVQPVGRRFARCPRPQAEAVGAMPLLEIRNLSVEFPTSAGTLRAVEDVSLEIEEGEVLGDRRRVRLRQERDDAGRHGSGAFSRPAFAPTVWLSTGGICAP